MHYTIGQVSEITGFSKYTLRYYDKEGLLPFVERTAAGVRNFSDSDLPFLDLISCLKGTGMSVKEIRNFIEWCMEGDTTLEARLHMFEEHKKTVEEKLVSIQTNLDKINHKISYYQKAVEAVDENKLA